MTILERISNQVAGIALRLDPHWITIQPRNITVQANIERDRAQFSKLAAEIETQIDSGVTVYIKKSLLNSKPEVNELLEESNGASHRIAVVKDLGVRWQCICETT